MRYTGVNVSKPFSIPLVTEVRRFALVIGARVWGELCQVESVSGMPAVTGLHSGGVDRGAPTSLGGSRALKHRTPA